MCVYFCFDVGQAFCEIYVLLENVFWLTARRIYQYLFWFTYYKVGLGWTIKSFFEVFFFFFFLLDFEGLGHNNFVFLFFRYLRGAVHSMAQFLWKFLLTMIKMIIVSLFILKFVLKRMEGGRNLHVYNLLLH